MEANMKKTLLIIVAAGTVLMSYLLWLTCRPVEIIAVHKKDNYSSVLVNNFPFTERGRINCWQENKQMLKNRYGVPRPDTDGFFTVIFWDFGDGYKEEGKYDRLCFDDMNPPANCIEKNKLFTVNYGRNMGLYFTTNNERYFINKDGNIIKMKDD
ncbi:DUF943 family protein [Tatumella ptyseos]|uniref:DUF943 family protein n=1 Tax=Tatumella ptyseos TaxID=82987 RepID=UPI0004A810AB|nr:DUF943 family protein [Tatumella ptyseos]